MIYFIAESNYAVKIGYTRCPVNERLSALQAANPRKLRLLAVFPDAGPAAEKALHSRLWRSRVRGEWYRFSDDVKAVIKFGLDHPGCSAFDALASLDPLPGTIAAEEKKERKPSPAVSRTELIRRHKILTRCENWTPIVDLIREFGGARINRMIRWKWLEDKDFPVGTGHTKKVRRTGRGDERLHEGVYALAADEEQEESMFADGHQQLKPAV